jgi:dimethylglycine dehydrogenase
VVGCSVLYHLTKAGWRDVVLLERDELTCGSTWHAAGGMHTLNSDPNVAKLQDYTIRLYEEIERLSRQSCGVHLTGGVMLAGTPERMDWLKAAVARGRYLGMKAELISTAEAKRLFPLLDARHFLGALFDPMEGHVDPAGVTNAYAKAARQGGAEIYRKTRVVDLEPRADGSWDVITDQGTIVAEHVVNAAGLWAREVGRMVGLELPVLAMEHHYLLTEDIPEVEALGGELSHAIDFEGELYLRQERNGILLGTYEQACVPWAPKETPADFSHELLAPDLERIAPSLEIGFRHFPPLEKAGIRQIINGPFTFAPDGNPLVGPLRGLPNFWCACGVMAGFSQGGGVGLALANWMIEGDPGFDVWAMDVARFGDFATRAWTNAKVRENYSRRFRITFPNEELPAGRSQRTTPLYNRLREKNAVLGASFGLRARALVRPAGRRADRAADLPPLQRPRARRRGMPRRARGGRPDRDLQLCQVRGHRPWRRGFSFTYSDQSNAARGPDRPLAYAERPRKADRRLHGRKCGKRLLRVRLRRRRAVPHALVRGPAPGRRQRPHPPAFRRASGLLHRRPQIARASRPPHRRGRDLGKIPLSRLPAARGRPRPGHGRPDFLHWRPRLRDLGARRFFS